MGGRRSKKHRRQAHSTLVAILPLGLRARPLVEGSRISGFSAGAGGEIRLTRILVNGRHISPPKVIKEFGSRFLFTVLRPFLTNGLSYINLLGLLSENKTLDPISTCHRLRKEDAVTLVFRTMGSTPAEASALTAVTRTTRTTRFPLTSVSLVIWT